MRRPLPRIPQDTPTGALSLLADQAAVAAGACGASISVRRDGGDVLLVASHPDVGELAEVEAELGEGPGLDVMPGGEPVLLADTLREERWPRYCRAALRRGVRSCLAAAGQVPRARATVTVYGLRPGHPGASGGPLAAAFAAQAAMVVTHLEDRERGWRAVEEMRDTLATRWPIEQAKGMIMQALGCDADEAFAELRKTSQNGHLKLRDVAHRLISRESAPEG
ncbi:ANTAR domain-containing protein [Sphaerisporangium sp. TRM90804]|uniref:ANTAR domain-containing protein n=1 Tax=Sphaerisporangium sp. TRM90804 TaxID=3031113 RepID=UPI002449C501|nr:ANTAR domain-containing protein [Sphaerisporangium sp. TRM90804]MDH2425416.1 ANTAR domain-containing protein [Sphaerisporangium sp. TRM90804]